VTGETYGGLKVLCEKVVEATYGKRATIIRPYLHRRPWRSHRRFHYWPVRVSKGGEMLAPGTPSDPFQYIDVRDLAGFIRTAWRKTWTASSTVRSAGRRHHGIVARRSKRITRADTRFVWVSPEFLEPTRSSARRPRATTYHLAAAEGRAGRVVVSKPGDARKKKGSSSGAWRRRSATRWRGRRSGRRTSRCSRQG
jgi:2'-hydroxyisoflavone reductase